MVTVGKWHFLWDKSQLLSSCKDWRICPSSPYEYLSVRLGFVHNMVWVEAVFSPTLPPSHLSPWLMLYWVEQSVSAEWVSSANWLDRKPFGRLIIFCQAGHCASWCCGRTVATSDARAESGGRVLLSTVAQVVPAWVELCAEFQDWCLHSETWWVDLMCLFVMQFMLHWFSVSRSTELQLPTSSEIALVFMKGFLSLHIMCDYKLQWILLNIFLLYSLLLAFVKVLM